VKCSISETTQDDLHMSGRGRFLTFLVWGVSITIIFLGSSIIIYKKKTRRLPPLTKQYILGTLLETMAGRFPQLVAENAREVGPIFRLAFLTWDPISVVCDPMLARQLLEADSNKAHGVRRFKEITFNHPNIISKNTFNDGWDWARKAVSPSFSHTNIHKMVPKLHERMQELVVELDKLCASGQKFDMTEIALKFTFNLVATSMFGVDYKLDFAEDSQSESAVFVHELHLVIVDAFRNKTIRIDRLWNGEPARAALGKKRLREFTQNILDKYRATHTKEETESDTSVLAHLVRGPYESDEARCADMIVFIIAGHDTTAYTIVWTLIELSRNSHIVDYIRDELDRVNRDEQDFSVSHLNQLDYLLAVIKESMRLNPVVASGSARRYDHEIRVQDYVIPRDTSILFPFCVIFRTGIPVGLYSKLYPQHIIFIDLRILMNLIQTAGCETITIVKPSRPYSCRLQQGEETAWVRILQCWS
jgi:cytochrome P450